MLETGRQMPSAVQCELRLNSGSSVGASERTQRRPRLLQISRPSTASVPGTMP
jgi:hypothetical protein